MTRGMMSTPPLTHEAALAVPLQPCSMSMLCQEDSTAGAVTVIGEVELNERGSLTECSERVFLQPRLGAPTGDPPRRTDEAQGWLHSLEEVTHRLSSAWSKASAFDGSPNEPRRSEMERDGPLQVQQGLPLNERDSLVMEELSQPVMFVPLATRAHGHGHGHGPAELGTLEA